MLRNAQAVIIALAVVAGIMAVISLVRSKGTEVLGWGLLALGIAVVLLAL